MNENQTIVKKTEREIDDFRDLWRRRRGISLLVILLILGPSSYTIYLRAVAIPDLQKSITTKDQEKAEIQKNLDVAIADKNKAELQLAPFLAVADKQFSEAPQEQRLELLIAKIDELVSRVENVSNDLISKRVYSEKTVSTIIARLKECDPLNFSITSVWGDQEALQLATQIKKIIEQSGHKVTGVSQAMYTNPIFGIKMNVLELPPKDAQSALALLFNEFGYERMVGTNDKLANNHIQIIVGQK
jgi:hypothetical protein